MTAAYLARAAGGRLGGRPGRGAARDRRVLRQVRLAAAGHARSGIHETEHRAYHEVAEREHLYRQRGLVLTHLTGWCEEALGLLEPVAAARAARAGAGSGG